jgi:hypothetical protein
MGRFNNPLDHVRIAAPCKADWKQMIGTERVRFCGQCNLNVYNLSSMTKTEAESLIVQTEGRLCVRFYRRTDGSILTDNCPVGLRAIRRRLSHLKKAVSATVLGFLAGAGVYRAVSTPPPRYMTGVMVAPPREGVFIINQPETPAVMGDMMGRPIVEFSPDPNSAERRARRHRDK